MLDDYCSSFAQLINGIILYKNQDPTGARLLLTKALKQAHGMIGSSQFVGQVLNMLAPVQKEREDRAGALQMFESATTLLKSVKDIMSLVTTLTGMATLYQEAKDTGTFLNATSILALQNRVRRG